jgi:hypothetical protein
MIDRINQEKIMNSVSKGEEELCYDLGQLMSERVANREMAQIEELTADLEALGVFVEDDEMGNGWRVLDMDGISLMPPDADSRGLVFSDKGYAWIYWAALGEPRGARLYVISDPKVEAEDEDGDLRPLTEREITRKTLRVIQGQKRT